ncbi:hypothetical protein EC957_005888 [Mortierella hygrophila]|uniref:Uncharacterized protein n=1 Tax=Mortierella hygrophila TaxID=979708 RepID=A0A9P6K6J3_9FUNG|nr:hypothetical protein EC957_005888 [Mortierella hygrophila]
MGAPSPVFRRDRDKTRPAASTFQISSNTKSSRFDYRHNQPRIQCSPSSTPKKAPHPVHNIRATTTNDCSSGTVTAASLNKRLAKKLSPEIARDIKRLVDWPMTMDEAKKHRELLMKERKYFVTTINEDVFERPFNLCEH